MKIPRFRISRLMACVAVAAFNFAALRAMFVYDSFEFLVLGLGTLPMVDVLGAGLLLAHRRPARRPFLLGFEMYGAVALGLFVLAISSCLMPRWRFLYSDWVLPYLGLVLAPLDQVLRPRLQPQSTLLYLGTLFTIGAAWLSLPQFAFALVGGWSSRKIRFWWSPLVVLAIVVVNVLAVTP
jgi:hypothetical protein